MFFICLLQRFLSLFLLFKTVIMICIVLFSKIYPIWNSLSYLNLLVGIFHQFQEVLIFYLSQYFSAHSNPISFWCATCTCCTYCIACLFWYSLRDINYTGFVFFFFFPLFFFSIFCLTLKTNFLSVDLFSSSVILLSFVFICCYYLT